MTDTNIPTAGATGGSDPNRREYLRDYLSRIGKPSNRITKPSNRITTPSNRITTSNSYTNLLMVGGAALFLLGVLMLDSSDAAMAFIQFGVLLAVVGVHALAVRSPRP